MAAVRHFGFVEEVVEPPMKTHSWELSHVKILLFGGRVSPPPGIAVHGWGISVTNCSLKCSTT